MTNSIYLDGGVIREWRINALMTQEEFAEKVGVTAETISRITNGHSASISTVRRICEVTGLSIDQLRSKNDSSESSRASEAS